MVRLRGSWALACALWIASTTARAETRDGAGAETLFEEGRKALDAGRYDEACAKLEESERLDPAPGTLLNLAECEEKRGRLAQAWAHMRHALDLLASNDERRPFAEARAKALEQRMPKLAVRLASSAPAPVDMRVVRDGTELPPASTGVLFPVDPGKHEIALIRGTRKHVVTVELAEGESRIALLDWHAVDVDPSSARRRLIGPLGLTAGAGTLVALTLGVTAGIVAVGQDATMAAHCTADRVCDPVGIDAGEKGQTYATISTVSLIAAAVLATATVFSIVKDY